MSFFLAKLRAPRGFTLVETLVAIGVFVVVMGVGAQLFLRSYAADRRIEASRELYEETRILLEKVVKEVRRGTVDYEEYWSWSHENADGYGQNYGEYAAKFFENAPARAEIGRQSLNAGKNQSTGQAVAVLPASDERRSDVCKADAAQANQQCELYLISADGTEKTILKVAAAGTADGEETYRLEMLKLTGSDCGIDGDCNATDILQGDTIPDTWKPATGYADAAGNPQFRPVQPDSLTITDFRFYVAPLEDPRRSFADFSDTVQVQPHVTLVLTTRPTARKLRGILGDPPTLTLQTTVTARAQNEVKSLPF